MITFEQEHRFSTEGAGTIIDITDRVSDTVRQSGILTGQAAVIVPGSTGAITTIEYEPGLLRDLPEFFEKIIPSHVTYSHDATWGDGNGFSHLRSALVGPGLTVPVSSGRLVLGTWQQIVFLEFDNRSRRRKIHVNVIGR
ncbi:MAG: YjbQ family protein [Candidatus Krumholzibacteriota bacterium]|nr:YjbQ family protein [Candidatus Krumholzibacteriota bacterium]